MKHRSVREVVDLLDEIDVSDPDAAHGTADKLLLEQVHPEIRAAYQRLIDRAPWWATA